MEDVCRTESSELKLEPTQEQLKAGIKQLDKYGMMNLIDSLAGGDLLKYESVLMMEYGVAFTKLRMNKDAKLFRRRYSEVIKNEQKNNR